MKVINLFGAPGVGKSTAAMGLVHEMKKRYHKGEYVSEFTKDLIWSGNPGLLLQQNFVLAEQSWRQERLKKHGVLFAVTDAPLMFSSYYGKKYRPDLPDCFHEWVEYSFNQFDNINFFIHRSHPYEPDGRVESEDESDSISDGLLEFLKAKHIPIEEISADDKLPLFILRKIGLDWVNSPS